MNEKKKLCPMCKRMIYNLFYIGWYNEKRQLRHKVAYCSKYCVECATIIAKGLVVGCKVI